MASELRTWLRWTYKGYASKWHIANQELTAVACGKRLNHDEYWSKDLAGVPVDNYGVCLHCLRAMEMANRVKEVASAVPA